MRSPRSGGLSARLALASLGTAVAIGVVCAVGLNSLEHASASGSEAVAQQLALIDDAAAMSAFQYQKGLVAEYLLTGDPAWLTDLENTRPTFEAWLVGMHATVGDKPSGKLLDEIQHEYTAYDQARRQSIVFYQSGNVDEAKAALQTNHARVQRLWALFRDFGRLARTDAEGTLTEERSKVSRLARVLVGTSIAGAVASLLVGFLWARRITKPIYELAVQVETAAERTRLKVAPGRPGLDALGDQVAALVTKLEETDADLAEHRRRLVQVEKLSAIGELAAKLAHEVLNPIAGMKVAVQDLARQGADAPGGLAVVETAKALNRETSRVEGLIRRLVNFARPLAPRIEVVTIEALIEAAVDAAQPTLRALRVEVDRSCDADLPPIEVDPSLVTQVLVNLLTNAAQATTPGGGSVEVKARRIAVLGRDEVSIQVSDRGSGIAQDFLPDLFKPFFTTKPDGHGLGLAVSQNIVLEHGGRILGANRRLEDGAGAIFEVQLPLFR